MTFTLLEMAKNLEIQQKLREEMQATIKKYDGKITYEGVAEMKYLDKVFCGMSSLQTFELLFITPIS